MHTYARHVITYPSPGEVWRARVAHEPQHETLAHKALWWSGVVAFFVVQYLLVLFVTASYTLTGQGPIRWDRGFKSTVCVVESMSLKGCSWDYILEQERGD